MTPTKPDPKELERLKLMQVRQLIGRIDRANPAALQSLLGRLEQSFKSDRLTKGRLGAGDASPLEEAQGLLVAVLMAAIEVND